MFENFSEDFTQSNNFKSFTGLNVVKVVAINPTATELKEVIGDRAQYFDTNYKIREDYSKNDVRPVVFWLQDMKGECSPVPLTINIGMHNVTFSTGSKQWVNDKLQSVINADLDNITFTWFDKTTARHARVGEVDYLKLISNFLRFNNSTGKLTEALQSENISFETVYNGDYSGLRKLADYFRKNEATQVMLYEVKVVNKDDKVYNNQLICGSSESWFRANNVSESIQKTLQEKFEKRAFTKNLFTVDWQEFKESDCLNYEDAPVATATKSSDDDIPDWLK